MSDCTHQTTSERRRRKANNVDVIVLQCMSCGRALRELPKAGRNLDALEWLDPLIAADWDARQRVESDRRQRQWLENYQNRTGKWWDSYKGYLLSDHWQQVRRTVLQRDRVCQKCFRMPAAEAHHLTYATFSSRGFSYPAECVGLCHDCHAEETAASAAQFEDDTNP